MIGWTNYPSFLVRSGLESGFTYGYDRWGAVNNYFSMYWAIFGIVITNQMNSQPGYSSASLLLASKMAVFCKKKVRWHSAKAIITKKSFFQK